MNECEWNSEEKQHHQNNSYKTVFIKVNGQQAVPVDSPGDASSLYSSVPLSTGIILRLYQSLHSMNCVY